MFPKFKNPVINGVFTAFFFAPFQATIFLKFNWCATIGFFLAVTLARNLGVLLVNITKCVQNTTYARIA